LIFRLWPKLRGAEPDRAADESPDSSALPIVIVNKKQEIAR